MQEGKMYKSIFSQTGQSFVEGADEANTSMDPPQLSTSGITRMKQIDENIKASPFVKAR